MQRRRLLREVLQRVVEGDEDRKLHEHRQAGGGRVDLVLPVELHQLLVLLLLVLLVLLLDLLHLRRVALQVLHRVDLLHRQRDERHPDDHGQGHDRPGPREADAEVQPVERVPRRVLERRQRRRDEEAEQPVHRAVLVGAGSKPPWLQGLQRSTRHAASALPRTSPLARRASRAYCEQDGWYLHVVGNSAPESRAVEPDRGDAEAVHQAATFVIDSTSSTRSPSQSKPFAATASGSPERTIST